MSSNVRVSDIAISAPAAWSIKGAVGGLTVLWGPTGSYKTFLAIGMSVCVAAGRHWFGSPVRPGPVLYILGEGGLDLFRRRVGEACRNFGVDVNELDLWVRGEALDLSNPKKLEPHFDGWDEICPTMIVVDTLSRCMPGDENSQESMQGFVNAMDTLRERWQATVMVIHHEGVESGRVRGSTVLPGAVDVSIRASAHNEGNRKVMKLEPKKLRELDTESFSHGKMFAERTIIKLEDGSMMLDDFGDQVSTLVIKDHPDYAASVLKVAEAFLLLMGERTDKDQWVGYREWKERVGSEFNLSASTFKRALATLLADVSEFGIITPQRGQYTYRNRWPEQPNPLKDFYLPGDNYDKDELERDLESSSNEEVSKLP